MYIRISVNNKIATLQDNVQIVNGNSDYVIKFDFDAEWNAYETKTARFVTARGYTDVVFSGDEVALPVITDAISVRVGVYAGNLHTTTPAVIFCRRCITDGSGSPADPAPDVYAQIMERLNNLSIVELDTTLTQSGKAADAKAVGDALAGKQNTISDLETIRSGAAKGATALQAVPSTYRTATAQDAIDNGLSDRVSAIEGKEAGWDAKSNFSGNYNDLTNKPTIPTALPNPNALTFTGAVTGSYDGSAPLSVEIPSGGGSGSDISLGLTGAAAGQIAKITAVDDTGKPTAWSPVDMPTGGGGSSGSIGELRRIAKVTLTEDASSIEITTDEDGNAFELVEYTYLIVGKSLGTTGNVGLKINDTLIYYKSDLSSSNTAATLHSGGHGSYAGGWYATYKYPYNTNKTGAIESACVHNIGKMTKFWYGCTNGVAGVGFQAGTVLELWGR